MLWLPPLRSAASPRPAGVSRLRRRYSCAARDIKEHDVLLLRQRGARSAKWHLTEPLVPGARVKLAYGRSVAASDLIGRRLLDTVPDSGASPVVLHEPSLANYIVHSQRSATPIYPQDANTIVSLLDLHPSRPGEDDDPDEAGPQREAARLEIFEAGTGMGSLTLHLARAIHAGNEPVPSSLRRALVQAHIHPRAGELGAGPEHSRHGRLRLHLDPDAEAVLDDYRRRRSAVLHTLDRKPAQSRDALRLVRNFRRAKYLPTVDFHVGSIDSFLSSHLDGTSGHAFLSHAILDLPSAPDNARLLAKALRPNGLLVLFQPSISQIAEFHAWCVATDQPLRLEKVLELPNTTRSDGEQDGTGGRSWDVKIVRPKNVDDDAEADHESHGGGAQPANLVQVMRPKVGDRVAGGGFVAVLRRWPHKAA